MPEAAQLEEELEGEDIELEGGEDKEEKVEEVNEKVNEENIALAKSMGWVDEEDFRGPKSNWVDADKFVEKGMNDLPVLRERLRAQSRRLADMEGDITDFKTHHEQSLAREYQRAMTELEDKQLATVEEGDKDEYQRIQKQKQELAASQPRTALTGSKAPENPLYSSWKDKNADWFEKDSDMTVYANRMSDYIAEMKPDLIGKQGFLDEIDKEVRARFSDRFENTNRDIPNTVEAGGRAPRQRGKSKGYGDLPGEAKAACDKFVRRGLITREQYVKDYEWE